MKIHFIWHCASFALSSCRKEIKSKQGGIDLISNIYINASKNLEDTQSFHIFQGSTIPMTPS